RFAYTYVTPCFDNECTSRRSGPVVANASPRGLAILKEYGLRCESHKSNCARPGRFSRSYWERDCPHPPKRLTPLRNSALLGWGGTDSRLPSTTPVRLPDTPRPDKRRASLVLRPISSMLSDGIPVRQTARPAFSRTWEPSTANIAPHTTSTMRARSSAGRGIT